MFLSELKEVCSMKHFPNISIDVVRTKSIPFALKASVKRCMYDLAANCIFTLDYLVKSFMRKYFLNAETIKAKELN